MAYCLAQQETFFLLELSSFFFEKKEHTKKEMNRVLLGTW